MAILEDLPNELLLQIITTLSNDDQRHYQFESFKTRDLQSLRLVSRKWSDLAAPPLFKNMVHDEQLLDGGALTRISRFAEEHPNLALHVQRLQRRLSPLFLDGPRFLHQCDMRLGMLGQTLESIKALENGRDLLDNLASRLRLEDQDNHAFDDVESRRSCCSRSRACFLHTVKSLPNLYHIESTFSTDWPRYLTALGQRYATNADILIRDVLDQNYIEDPNNPLTHHYQHFPDFITPSVKSLKLLGMPLFMSTLDNWSHSLRGLEHLDIECEFAPASYIDDGDLSRMPEHALRFRSQLQKLTNLRTLRLTCPRVYDVIRQSYRDYIVPVHIDDILHDINFPRLTSLSLVDWPIREAGLVDIIRLHSSNLKIVELQHLSLNVIDLKIMHLPNSGLDVVHLSSIRKAKASWCHIAAECAKCISIQRYSFRSPGFHYVRQAPPNPLLPAHEQFTRLKGGGFEDTKGEMVHCMYGLARGRLRMDSEEVRQYDDPMAEIEDEG